MLLAVPKYGRVKVNKVLVQCRISPSKTIGGLSQRQRTELVSCCAASGAPGAPRAAGLRHHRPLRGRQGHADPHAARARARAGARPCRPRRARRGRARTTASTTTSSPTRSSSAASRRASSSSTPRYSGRRYGTLRSELERRTGARACPSCWRSRCRARARSRESMPEAVQIFIAPPGDEALRARLDRSRHRRPRSRSRARLPSRARSSRRRASSRTWWSTTGWRTRSPSSSARPGALATLSYGRTAADEGTLLISPRVDRLIDHVDSQLRERDRGRQARPADQLVLPQPRRGDVRGVPAADGRHGRRRTTSRSPSRKSRAARSSTATGRTRGPARWPASCSGSAGASRPTRRWSSPAWP